MSNNMTNIAKKQVVSPNVSMLTQRQLYERLEEYYENNNLYFKSELLAYYLDIGEEALKGLYTPVYRSVEFYVSKVVPNKLTVTANKQTVIEAINKFNVWSNYESQKKLHIRELAKKGDLFIKVVSEPNKLYSEIIDAADVTFLEEDSRGNVTKIRIDNNRCDDDDSIINVTEYWDVENNYMGIWEHNLGENAKLSELGDPILYEPLQAFVGDNSFIPIVHIKFKDNGTTRGDACVKHALSKIDEANRIATFLHRMYFNNGEGFMAIKANSTGPNGEPLPAPKITDRKSGTTSKDNNLSVSNKRFISLPGMADLTSVIPGINYDSGMNIVNNLVKEIEKDLPELKYYSVPDAQNLSGKALKNLLGAAVDVAIEARDNYFAGLARLYKMALTIGQFIGLFTNIGNYDNGDFEHTLTAGEMFPQTIDDKAITLKSLVDAGLALATAMRFAGFTEDEITKALEEQANDTNNILVRNLTKAQNNFNGG